MSLNKKRALAKLRQTFGADRVSLWDDLEYMKQFDGAKNDFCDEPLSQLEIALSVLRAENQKYNGKATAKTIDKMVEAFELIE